MPRSKNDPHKRKCAQALNHMAAAILDINDVFIPFEQSMKRLQELAKETIDPADENNAERYKTYCDDLRTIMLGVNACREHLLLFTGQVWNLDEDTIKVYLG